MKHRRHLAWREAHYAMLRDEKTAIIHQLYDEAEALDIEFEEAVRADERATLEAARDVVWVTRDEANWLEGRYDQERVIREVGELYDDAMEDKRASDFVFAFNDHGLTYGTMRLARAILATPQPVPDGEEKS